jgi:hypothetical protein
MATERPVLVEEDWLSINSDKGKAIVAVQSLVVTFMYIWFVLLRWGSFIPVLMFYQHYLTAISSGLGCLAITVQYRSVLWAQIFFALGGLVSSGMYLSQIAGDETLNFSGTIGYPKLAQSDIITITAANITRYDKSLGLFIGDIVLTSVEFLQNLLLNVFIPWFILILLSRQDHLDIFQDTSKTPRLEHCDIWQRILYTVTGIFIVIIGIVQGFLAWYFLIDGVLLLSPITNLNYMLYFVTAAGIVPAWRTLGDNNGLVERGISPPSSPEDEYYRKSYASAYNWAYMLALGVTWVLALCSLFVNLSWSQENNIGGGICPSYENTTLVMSGQQTLNYFEAQLITYGNLTSTVIVNSAPYNALVVKTENNIRAVYSFTCSDLWLNWILLALFTGFMCLHAFLMSYKGKREDVDGSRVKGITSGFATGVHR